MTTLTPEQRQEIEKAGDEPIHLEDPETHKRYVLIRADVYESLRGVEDERHKTIHSTEAQDATGRREEDPVRALYPLIDRTFHEGWETPEMAEYDQYEKHRPCSIAEATSEPERGRMR